MQTSKLGSSGSRIVDVCVIVRNLYKDILDIGITLSPPVRLKRTLIGVISRHVTPGKVYEIRLEPKPFGNRVWGMLRRYPDHAVVMYKGDLNVCWTRYVVSKELSHLLIDTDARHFTRDPVSLAQALIAGLPSNIDAELESEYAAGYAAVELLLPWCLRPLFNSMVESGATDLQIADTFKCPAIYVSMMRGKYGEFSRDANQFSV